MTRPVGHHNQLKELKELKEVKKVMDMGDTATVSEYIITGMVCQHCVSAVTQELSAIESVTDVQVDLATGQVTVTSDGPLDDAEVRAAIDEAGYEISAEIPDEIPA